MGETSEEEGELLLGLCLCVSVCVIFFPAVQLLLTPGIEKENKLLNELYHYDTTEKVETLIRLL